MMTANLETALECVSTLTEAERQELRNRLDAWPASAPTGGEPVQDVYEEVDRRLLEAGLILRAPSPVTDSTPDRVRKLVEVEGKPISETILEERR